MSTYALTTLICTAQLLCLLLHVHAAVAADSPNLQHFHSRPKLKPLVNAEIKMVQVSDVETPVHRLAAAAITGWSLLTLCRLIAGIIAVLIGTDSDNLLSK